MKPIFIAASPNTESDDVVLAVKQLVNPLNWYSKSAVRRFELAMESYLSGGVQAVAVDSARSAFYLLLKAYGVGPGDEVILPAFSCLVIANPVKWVGATPVFVDINPQDLNLDLKDLKAKLSSHTKVVLIQHTFGLVIDIARVRKIVGNKVKLVEDVAHALGGELSDQKLGTIADAAVLTFGIEKSISSVRGGMLISKDGEMITKIREDIKRLPKFPRLKLILALKNPLLWTLITPIYYLGFGKLTLGRMFTWVLHKFNLLGNMIESCEYRTIKPKWIPAQMPGALANLASHQLAKLDRYNQHRRNIASIYQQELGLSYPILTGSNPTFLRFPVLVKDADQLLKHAKKQKIVLGDWYRKILYAPQTTLDLLGYQKGSAKLAETYSHQIVNLPTHIKVSAGDAIRIAKIVRPFIAK